MPNATVRATARALPKSAKTAPEREYLRRLYQPGVQERGLKILAKAQDEAAAKKAAPTPENKPTDEYVTLPTLGKIIADARLEAATTRLSELEHLLHDAVAWAGMLDEAIERIDRFPSLTRDEMNLACHHLNLVADALREAIDRLDAAYHQRTKEEATQRPAKLTAAISCSRSSSSRERSRFRPRAKRRRPS
jgi:hypothetical protein